MNLASGDAGSKETPGTPHRYVGFHVGPMDDAERTNVSRTLIGMVTHDVAFHKQPVVTLIRQTPKNPRNIFLGFGYIYKNREKDYRRAHYVLLIGHRGGYSGSDGTGEFVFRESSSKNGRNMKIYQENIDVNILTAELEANNGDGGNSKEDWNVLY